VIARSVLGGGENFVWRWVGGRVWRFAGALTAMIVSRTPLRITSGWWYRLPRALPAHGGQSLAVAIDKYSYVAVNPVPRLFEHRSE
jgi:hypothetical protein